MISHPRVSTLLLILISTVVCGVAPAAAQLPDRFQQLREKDLEGALATLAEIHDAGLFWSQDQGDAIPAFVGGVARLLSQKDEEVQYDLLHEWTMPTESRQRVRIVTSPVPSAAPPEIFARVLRERPREKSFEVSSINGIRGLFCSGWKLVTLADELGRLDRLTTDLEELTSQKIPNADVLLLLANMVQRQPEFGKIRIQLTEVVKRVSQTHPDNLTAEKVLQPSLLALGAAALRSDELAPEAEALLLSLRKKADGLRAYRMRAFLHAAHAVAIQRVHGSSGPDLLYQNPFKYWVSASLDVNRTSAEGVTPDMWLCCEDHLLHLAGGYNDLMFFRYPLQGEFSLTGEVQATRGAVTDCAMGYGGLFFRSAGRVRAMTVWDADLSVMLEKPCPFAREETNTTFNRVEIEGTAQGTRYTINRHPLWFDNQEAAASPFVGFHWYGNHRSLIRNLKLTGHPVIPRQVELAAGTQLRGWQSRFFGESKRSAQFELNPAATFDWYLDEGVIHARKNENVSERQSLLKYQRPMLENETVQYEFFYVPGETEVHPALGRLAFLIEPGGVRIHWITDGRDEWTGLPDDNVTLEPLSRRGPRPLPLKEKDWNAVELVRAQGQITLSLNGETIYQRPVELAQDTNFGLFRDPSQVSVQVRKVILTGDWPETVPEECLQNLAAVNDPAEQQRNQLSLHLLAGSDMLAANLNEVRRQAAAMSPEERFEFLRSWVLPNEIHPDIRLFGEFTQTDPSPLARQLEPYRFHDPRGAEPASPAFELLSTAIQLGRIEELSKQLDALPESDDLDQQRARLAMQIMLTLEQGERDRVVDLIDQLQGLTHECFRLKIGEYWPELHVIVCALHRHENHEVVGGLISDLFQQRLTLGMERLWQNHILSLMRDYQSILHELPPPSGNEAAGLKNWIPVTKGISKFRGMGSPCPGWMFNEDHVLTLSAGHNEDYLFYRSPLVGDYEVHGKIAEWGISQILTLGTFLGPHGDTEQIQKGSFHTGGRTLPQPYAAQKNDVHAYYRSRVEQGRARVYINGQQVADYTPDSTPDQWVGLRALSNSNTSFYNVQIVGNPAIPDEISMTTADNLSCWLPYYLGTREFTWNRIDDGAGNAMIQSGRRPDLAGSHFEGLLRYHRPLIEDGSIEYEFLYTPGESMAHPALDRLVFLLDPDGVKIHWLTDEKYDETAVPPDNVVVEPENRRGPDTLPLVADDWNRLKLSITGQTVSLELNGTPIYQRELELTNRRTFGLFHYADRNELWVRNPVMRADWPKSFPALAEQELSDPALTAADGNLSKLTKTFTHDFGKAGYPDEYFLSGRSNVAPRVEFEPDGLRVTMRGGTDWNAYPLIARFGLQGDFDVQAQIADLDFENAGTEASAFIDLKLDDEQQQYLRIMRRWTSERKHDLNAQSSPLHPNGHRSWISEYDSDIAPTGTLRISRIGKRIIFMFAEEDCPVFRTVRDEVISDGDVLLNGIELKTATRDGGQASTLWKNFTIRAEHMTHLPPYDVASLQRLWVMNTDGTNVRELTGLLPELTTLGSPEFSYDGKQIALDMSQGSVANSHIIVLNADGTNIRDLGAGCMPSFSPDGKRIAFTQSGSGIMRMDTDGSNREVVDESGWGVQYSPDGKYLAYGRLGNITLLNLQTKETREVLKGADVGRYSYTYWNLGWSHDSRSIAFKGRLRAGGDEVAVVDIEAGSLTVLDPDATRVNPDFTFTSDNQSVMFSKSALASPLPKLYTVSRKSPGQLEFLKGQPDDRLLNSCDVSPDGQLITFTGQLDPQPVEWNPPEEKRAPAAADR